MENQEYLSKQILTYLGNKRALLGFIEQGLKHAKEELGRDKLRCVDMFSGSGIVARFLKRHSSFLIANDLELYSKITNECYLANVSAKELKELGRWYEILLENIKSNPQSGFVSELYAPKDQDDIRREDRVFYTKENALYIDTARAQIENLPEAIRRFFIAPLLYEASTKANTSGVFKGFYKNKNGIGQFGGEGKNALGRIMGRISLPMPIFSKFNVPFAVCQKDANDLAGELEQMDVVYLDPPYNQHPYSSNYFMLNLIAKNERPQSISRVSGIAKGWNKSVYNKKSAAEQSFFELVGKLKAKFIIISFNSEGFIERESFERNLTKFGELKVLEQRYNAFRGSRNLGSRSLHVTEFLYILKKIGSK
ncbi:DNA adenine methylase [Campylobacter curvus]|uniref:DNA adenine methylase n=1 Tax=Campylobacter curvus TaxID=200 RepID=UPI0014701879|nr:DNA adenine methylase [Campylobacter curvus]